MFTYLEKKKKKKEKRKKLEIGQLYAKYQEFLELHLNLYQKTTISNNQQDTVSTAIFPQTNEGKQPDYLVMVIITLILTLDCEYQNSIKYTDLNP